MASQRIGQTGTTRWRICTTRPLSVHTDADESSAVVCDLEPRTVLEVCEEKILTPNGVQMACILDPVWKGWLVLRRGASGLATCEPLDEAPAAQAIASRDGAATPVIGLSLSELRDSVPVGAEPTPWSLDQRPDLHSTCVQRPMVPVAKPLNGFRSHTNQSKPTVWPTTLSSSRARCSSGPQKRQGSSSRAGAQADRHGAPPSRHPPRARRHLSQRGRRWVPRR